MHRLTVRIRTTSATGYKKQGLTPSFTELYGSP
jgi:hypothetical protein